MKLESFVAKGVFGHLDFSLRFGDSIVFLVGANGSGKSTAIKLMEAILTPSIKELAEISFRNAEVSFIESGKSRTIYVDKLDSHLLIRASWINDSLNIKELGNTKASLLLEDHRSVDEFFRSLTITLSTHQTFAAISSLSAPVFLGIDRRHRTASEEMVAKGEMDDGRLYRAVRRGGEVRRILKGNLAASLSETQSLIQEAYRSARRRLDILQAKLRDEVLLSAFHYSEIDREPSGVPSYSEFGSHSGFDVSTIREDIETTLAAIGLEERKVQERIGPFFDKLSRLVGSFRGNPSERDPEVTIEFLMNKGQLDRLQELLKLVQDHKRKSDDVMRKLNSFKSTINHFFYDSKKEIDLDPVGRLVITRSNNLSVPLDALSSGERQLLIIFSHLFFNAYSSRSKVFVIDEPELSLHLRWQSILVDKIREDSPDVQLIFATHSPDIVGANTKYCVQVG